LNDTVSCSPLVRVELPAGGIPYAAPIPQRSSCSWEKPRNNLAAMFLLSPQQAGGVLRKKSASVTSKHGTGVASYAVFCFASELHKAVTACAVTACYKRRQVISPMLPEVGRNRLLTREVKNLIAPIEQNEKN
jgi:hypothetical protein